MRANKNAVSPRSVLTLMLCSLAAGLVMSFFRARQLAFAYDAAGLLSPDFSGTLVLRIVSILFIVAAFAGILALNRRFYIPSAGYAKAEKTGYIIAAFALLAGSVYELVSTGTGITSRLIFMALSVFAAFSLIISAVFKYRTEDSAAYGGGKYSFFRLMPVFWCCFWLILLYRDRSPNPTIEYYAYELLAVSCGVLAIYYSSGDAFGSYKPAQSLIFCVLTVFFCAVSSVGQIFAGLFFGDSILLPDSTLFVLGLGIYAFSAALGVVSAPEGGEAESLPAEGEAGVTQGGE